MVNPQCMLELEPRTPIHPGEHESAGPPLPPRPSTSLAASIEAAFGIALDTLWSHKLRSSLTLLGIVIGIAAVVLVGAAIRGLGEYAVTTTAQAFGSNTFLVSQIASVGNLDRKELSDKLRRNPEIYRHEAESLTAATAAYTRTASALQESSDIKAGNRTFLAASITGASESIERIRDVRLSRGRFYTEEENRHSMRVAILGRDVADELFPTVDPLGRQVRISGEPFTVIGLQEKQGSSFGSSLDRYVWVPLGAFEKIWGSRRSLTLFIQPRDGVGFEEAQEIVRNALRLLRRIRPASPDNFDILVPEAGRSFLARLTGMIAVAIVPISSVALFVAGIVVMNMMLVSVTERTREIGIRKSLGARRQDIYAQIILESTILTVIGGALGVVISYLGTLALSEAFGLSIGVPVLQLALAIGVAAVIGLGAGWYPARVASRMPPIEALRSET
jgi:putative ABC transport system permease protein